MEQDIWQYSVSVSNCTHGNQTLDYCPLRLYVRGGGLPSKNDNSTHELLCQNSNQTEGCQLNVTGPLIENWHYLAIENVDQQTGPLAFILKIWTHGETYINQTFNLFLYS